MGLYRIFILPNIVILKTSVNLTELLPECCLFIFNRKDAKTRRIKKLQDGQNFCFMKKNYLSFALFFGTLVLVHLSSQGFTQSPQFGLGADFVSRYIWRGADYGNSPAIQPNASFSVAGFKIGAWGSYSFGPYSKKINDSTVMTVGNFIETDFTASYTLKGFALGFTDYFFPNQVNPNVDNNYFNYKNATTGHTIEAFLSYAGPDKFPLQVFAGVLVYGADKGKDSTGVIGLGTTNNYSAYFEAGYQFTIKSIGVKPFIGAIPYASSWYGKSAGIVNLGFTASKSIRITNDFSLPVYTSIITNPQAESIFFVFGLTL
jgi:hypothetical protein